MNESTAQTLAAPEFFYRNLRIQETLTTIRYGIEARKGLTIITGAPGIGKSIVLRQAAVELAGNITCLFESDPRVGFSDVLRLILRNLDDASIDNDESAPANEDESAMVRRCRMQLRARLERCQIVALFLDNADQFADQTLRSITQTFLAGSAEDPEGTLLQLILAGRAELKTKISRAALIPLRRRKPIMCELQPLNSGEVGAFIEQSLKRSDRPTDVFDERAIKRIALYANGNPGMIHSICERVLQSAGGSSDVKIPAELVESAAGELDVQRLEHASSAEIFSPSIDTAIFAAPKSRETVDDEHDMPYKFSTDTEVPHASILPLYATGASGENWQPPKRQTTAWKGRLTLVILLVGIAGLIGAGTLDDVLRNGMATLNRHLPPHLKPDGPAKISDAPIETGPFSLPNRPDPPSASPEPTPAPQAGRNDFSPASEPDKLSPPSEKSSSDGQARFKQKNAPTVKPAGRSSTKVDSDQLRDHLQIQISKAIENRAIMGIEVSVIQGTAYLDGHVASERQRRAAERAARSVAGVERVRNRIAITFG